MTFSLPVSQLHHIVGLLFGYEFILPRDIGCGALFDGLVANEDLVHFASDTTHGEIVLLRASTS